MGMDVEMGEISMEEDDKVTFRDEVVRSGDDMEIVGVGKEKLTDSGKHRSNDGKKGRHADKDHRSREKGKSERDADFKIESGRHDTADRDRIDIRERMKEDRPNYGKDKEREKEQERYKERTKDKILDDHEREKYRERNKGRIKEHDGEKVQGAGLEHEKSRDREKNKGRDREKTRELDKENDQIHDEDWQKERDLERSKGRERDYDKYGHNYLERGRGKEKDREKGKVKDRERERDRARRKDKEKLRDSEKDKEKLRDSEKDKEKLRDSEKDKERDKLKEKYRAKEMDKNSEKDKDKSRSRDKTKATTERKDERTKADNEDGGDIPRKDVQDDLSVPEETGFKGHPTENPKEPQPSYELQERVKKMKEDRIKMKTEGASEILSWVNRSRKLKDKKVIEKGISHRSTKGKDDILEGSDEDEAVRNTQKELAGVKILHGLEKVMEGGAVILTLKDQNILADGDVNEEIDMLENVEIGQQKQRHDAYKAAKKKTGLYDDKFNDDLQTRRSILPQYDDPVEDEGVELDESGQFTGEAERKLEDLRKRLEGRSLQRNYEDLSTAGRVSSDYYTPEEMIQFKKPKKKKSLRKREKLDLDVLEAEAISSGLGASDRGSRNDMRRQAVKEEQERIEAEKRSNAYQVAYNKAEEASKILRQEQTFVVKNAEQEEDIVFGEDYEDLQRSLDQSRKIALKKQESAAGSGPQAIALLVTAKGQDDNQLSSIGETQEKQVVITEMEEFVLGLQFNEDHHIPQSEDVFMDKEGSPEPETKDDIDGLADPEETNESELIPTNKEDEDVNPDEIIHEVPVGKGLSGALKLLKDRGTLNETIDLGGRNMDKKKSKLVGLYDNQGQKEIRIERTDEFGRIMTPKEAFRVLSHKFHGKGPGKMKQEKRMKQYQEDLKRKQMKASDTPLLAMERMREAQAQLQQPYLVLSGHVKPGQTSDPRSGFATVEKDHFGSLTPMLGDKKVEHFLGIKRKPEAANLPPLPQKKPKG